MLGPTQTPSRERSVPEEDSSATADLILSTVDVRRKRPPALSFILRLDTLRRGGRIVSLLALDFSCLFSAILTGLAIKAFVRTGQLNWHALLHETRSYIAFAFLVTALLFARAKLYSERAQRPALPRIVSSLFLAMVISLIFALVTGQHYSSYYIFYSALFFSLLYVGGTRWLYDRVTGRLLKAAGYRQRTLLIGSGLEMLEVGRALKRGADVPLDIVGYVGVSDTAELETLGSTDQLPQILAATAVDEVVITDPRFPEDVAVRVVDQCHSRGITVRVAPSTMEILVQRAEFVPGSSVPLFEVRPPVFEGLDYVLKRMFDFVVALLLLAIFSPLLALLALGVCISSRGPIFYKSVRPGIGGRTFSCLKFRTMRSNADQIQADLESLNEASGALFKIRADPRMTKFGRFLRRYSLDELPQLVNVLLGQMSLVGPRPLPERDFNRLEDWHKKRYLVLPGITGLWQVSGRSELDFDDLVRLDFLYLERWSIGLDLAILVKTVPAVFSRHGAF